MTQKTEVFRIQGGEVARLRKRLAEAGFEERALAHAHFQARGEDVVVSCYRSGKLVVQGSGASGFAVRFLGGAMPEPKKKKEASSSTSSTSADTSTTEEARMGSDEAGKGDSFGGITVAAVAVPLEDREELIAAGVTDSKALTDARVRVLAPWIRDHYTHAEAVLDPASYNERHRAAGSNVNRLLTDLHGELLENLFGRTEIRVAWVDRFSPREPVSARLQGSCPDLKVVERPRAEAEVAVAAASVLARESFLLQLEELRDAWACKIPLGSGAPVPPALRSFLKLHGREALGQVAKLHFANVKRIAEELPWS